MFLQKLIARAEGTAPVLQNAPPLARELDDPTWGSEPGADLPDPDLMPPPAAKPAARAAPQWQAAQAAPSKPAGAPASPMTAAAQDASPPPVRQHPAPGQPLAVAAPPPTGPAIAALRPVAAPTFGAVVPPPAPPQLTPKIAVPPPSTTTPAAQPTQPAAQRPIRVPAPAPHAPAVRQWADPAPPHAPAEAPDRIEVDVRIGQLDLVSPPQARPRTAPKATAARPAPGLSLTDYLDRRRGDRR